MKKNIFRSMVKSIVRAIWKILFRPLVKMLPEETKIKKNLIIIDEKIDQRNWWGIRNSRESKSSVEIDSSLFEVNDFLKSELNDLSLIEPLLTPNFDFIHRLSYHSATPSDVIQPASIGSVYGLIFRYLRDLGLLHHINAQDEKGYCILLITTENFPSTWLDKLPKSVKYLNFAEFTFGMEENIQLELLARILLQTSAQTIHNINSRLGWEVYKNYNSQFAVMNQKLFSSVFCEDKVGCGVWFGYAPSYLPNIDLTDLRIFCDTQWYPNTLIQRFRVSSNIFNTIYFPYMKKLCTYSAIENKPILWASRIAAQKRPELLYQIAKEMPDQLFHIYGECEQGFNSILEQLKLLPNVQYFGKYDDFATLLKDKEYSVFLYTSEYDGLPNVLIEAISVGLPVISYDVGGVRELIHKDVLLSTNDEFSDTLEKIKLLLNQPKVLHNTWQYSHDIVKQRHSWKYFVETLEQVDGYFPKLSREEFIHLNSNMRILSKPI